MAQLSEHRPHGLDRAGDRFQNRPAQFLFKLVDREQRRLDITCVLRGFDQQKISTAFDQRLGLGVEARLQLLERDVTGHRDRAGRGAHGARDEARLVRRRALVGSLARELSGDPVDLGRFMADVVFAQRNFVRVERVGLDDVGAGGEIRAVDAEDHVRPREHEMIVAALERSSAKIRGSQVLLLDHGTHGPVEDQYPIVERSKKRCLPIVHACLFQFSGKENGGARALACSVGTHADTFGRNFDQNRVDVEERCLLSLFY